MNSVYVSTLSQLWTKSSKKKLLYRVRYYRCDVRAKGSTPRIKARFPSIDDISRLHDDNQS